MKRSELIARAAVLGWITASEAAERLGVSRQRVADLAKRGRLIGRRAGTLWFFAAGDIALRKRNPVPAGRPRSRECRRCGQHPDEDGRIAHCIYCPEAPALGDEPENFEPGEL